MDANTKLLPCPFCGAPGMLEDAGSGRWSVGCSEEPDDEGFECVGYISLTTYATQADATKAWNRRAPSLDLPDLG